MSIAKWARLSSNIIGEIVDVLRRHHLLLRQHRGRQSDPDAERGQYALDGRSPFRASVPL